MHPKYQQTIQQILAWAQAEESVQGILMIGSQARTTIVSDQWSDLDLMVLVEDPQRWLADSAWFRRFGEVVCCFAETVPLQFNGWDWIVRRVLYADDRDVDFSLLPIAHLEEVISVNRDILARGYRVLYDAIPGRLEAKTCALVGEEEKPAPQPVTKPDLDGVVSELLYHVIWSLKKIRRGELWVAVSCINCHMKGLLLRLIEAYNVTVCQQPDPLAYNGRFLEQRADPEVLAKLAGCFTRYDEEEAIQTLHNLMDFIHPLAREIYQRKGWVLDEAMFEGIQKMYEEMKGEN